MRDLLASLPDNPKRRDLNNLQGALHARVAAMPDWGSNEHSFASTTANALHGGRQAKRLDPEGAQNPYPPRSVAWDLWSVGFVCGGGHG